MRDVYARPPWSWLMGHREGVGRPPEPAIDGMTAECRVLKSIVEAAVCFVNEI